MATHDATTSRRSFLGALTTLPALGLLASPALAEAPQPTPEPDDGQWSEGYERGHEIDQEIALEHMAAAWIDRWEALGGNFGLRYDRQGEPDGIMRGMLCGTDLWTDRTDVIHPKLPPHARLIEDGHHDGAVKVLEGLLTLVPGLQDAVRVRAGYRLVTRRQSEA